MGMRVLVLSSVFPNPRQPNLGVFIRERVRRVARSSEVQVVAPVPWFPLDRVVRGRRWGGIPQVERRDGLVVHHPRFVSVPRFGKSLDGILYAASLLGFVRRLRRSFPFEMIDAHFAYPDGMAGVLLGKALGCPVMITLRGSIVRLATYPLHRPQLRFTLRAADRIIAVSESLKRVAVDLGIGAEKIRVIPNGVDTSRFFPMDQGDARRRLALPLDASIVLTVGGVYEGKGQHLVLEALPRLLARDPRVLYVVVGGERVGDSYRRTLDGIIRAHGLAGHVLFVGSKAHEDLRAWYAAADALCLATRSEGRANVLLESIARRSHPARAALIAALLVIAAASSRAAAQTDVIRGRVTNTEGLPLPRVRVTATSIPGNVTREARTNDQGAFQIAFPGGPGDYIMGYALIGYNFRQFEIKRVADEDVLIADARLTGPDKVACTATEWVLMTGTRTQVAATFSPGRPRILRDSLRIFSSSDDQPSALSEPAHGTTFIASGAGNGPRSPTTERTSPARCPSDRDPATLSSCA